MEKEGEGLLLVFFVFFLIKGRAEIGAGQARPGQARWEFDNLILDWCRLIKIS